MTTHEEVAAAVAPARPAIERICTEVWDLAELSLHEIESAKVHLRELERAGFVITSTGTAGVPTAFVAEWSQGEGGAKVGFLPEYDALPGLGNAAVPRRQPREDGSTAGHGCGHNLLGAGLTGAAIAAKAVMEGRAIPGTLRVYGCAAEETEGAKVYFARARLFDDLDACLHWHPGPVAGVINLRLSATNIVKIELFGRSAHAGLAPWKGRSALHAMELAAHGLNVMRQHLEPTARLHYIYEAAGTAPNIVPDYARLYLYVRDLDRARVVATTEWVAQVAEGAALATQTTARVECSFGMHDLLPNRPLAERMQLLLERHGVPDWSAEEQVFARACQREVGIEESGLATAVMPLQDEPAIGGSSDVADVSWNVPTMGIAMPTMPLGVDLHSWPVTACGGVSIGRSGAVAAAAVLAHTALDVLTDPELRAETRADFERRTLGFTYVSPLPSDQASPVGVPEWLTVDGSAEALADFSR